MRVLARVATTTAVLAILAAVGCSTQSRMPADDTTSKSASGTPSGAASDSMSARSKVAQLEADARALAKTTGCNSVSECRTAPVGERPCGGPRDYIAYCAATTDTVALFKKLDELKAAEIEFNKSSNAMSTCEFRSPPVASLVGGSCRAGGSP
jgi:hypothetical protein